MLKLMKKRKKIKTKKQNATTGLRTQNNILTTTKPLHAKMPSFTGDNFLERSSQNCITYHTSCWSKLACYGFSNGSNNIALKKGQGAGGLQNQLVNRALEGEVVQGAEARPEVVVEEEDGICDSISVLI